MRTRTIAGELIVKLTAEGAGRLRERLPRRRFLYIREGRHCRTGIDSIDRLLQHAGIKKIRRICGGPRSVLNSVYLALRFDENQSAYRLAGKLRTLHTFVASAQPNCLRCGQALPSPGPILPGHLQMIGWNAQLALNPNATFPLVAVLDSGIFRTPFHPQLGSAIESEFDVVDTGGFLPSGFQWQTRDARGHDLEADDEVGHGTRMASVLAARASNGASVIGVAPRARLMIVRVLAKVVTPRGPNAFGTSIDVVEGINAAVNAGARVINMSFGFPRRVSIENEAVREAVQKGCFVVCAIGNDGPNSGPLFPAAYRGAFAVGTVDSAGALWPGTQTGNHLALTAPGVAIPAIDSSNVLLPSTGTSPAAAIVSGIAALLIAVRPNLTPVQVGRLLVASAVGPNRIVNLSRALASINTV